MSGVFNASSHQAHHQKQQQTPIPSKSTTASQQNHNHRNNSQNAAIPEVPQPNKQLKFTNIKCGTSQNSLTIKAKALLNRLAAEDSAGNDNECEQHGIDNSKGKISSLKNSHESDAAIIATTFQNSISPVPLSVSNHSSGATSQTVSNTTASSKQQRPGFTAFHTSPIESSKLVVDRSSSPLPPPSQRQHKWHNNNSCSNKHTSANPQISRVESSNERRNPTNGPLAAVAAIAQHQLTNNSHHFNQHFHHPPYNPLFDRQFANRTPPIISEPTGQNPSVAHFPPTSSLITSSSTRLSYDCIKRESPSQAEQPSAGQKAQKPQEEDKPFAVPALPARPRIGSLNRDKEAATSTEKQKLSPAKFELKETGEILKEKRSEESSEQSTSDKAFAEQVIVKLEQQDEESNSLDVVQKQKPAPLVDYCESPQKEEEEEEQLITTDQPEITTLKSPESSIQEEDIEPQPSTSKYSEPLAESQQKPLSSPKAQTPLKPVHLVLRISAAAAIRLRRLANHHGRALRRIGVSTLQFEPKSARSRNNSSQSPNLVQIPARSPTPEAEQRRSRLQLIRQQQQLLLQRNQQQLAASIAHQQQQQQRATLAASGNSANKQQQQSPLVSPAPGGTFSKVGTGTSVTHHTPQAILQNRQTPASAGATAVPQPSYPQPQQHPSSVPTTPHLNKPSPAYPHPQAPPSQQPQQQHMEGPGPSNTIIAQQQHQMMASAAVAGTPSTPHHNQMATNGNTATGVAENSPLLVNLLSNNMPNASMQQQASSGMPTPQQQQQHAAMMAAQQQRYASSGMPSQQQQTAAVAGSSTMLNAQQQHQMYQQQLQQQQQQQRAIATQQQQQMMYGNAAGHPGMMNAAAAAQQHYMMMGAGGPQFRPGMPPQQMAAIAQMHPGMMGPGVPAPPPYYTGQMGPNPHQMMASGMPGTSAPAPGMATMMKPGAAPVQAEEPPKKRKRISKKQQQKEERERAEQQLRIQQEQQQQQQQQQAAMAAAMHMRQQQMAAYMHQQQQQQKMISMGGNSNVQTSMMPVGIPAAANPMGPSPPHGMMSAGYATTPPGQIQQATAAQQQHYQQQMAQYHHQQQYTAAVAQQQRPPQAHGGFNSPVPGCAPGGPYSQTTPPSSVPSGPSPQQQQFITGNQYMMSPQQQQQAMWAGQMTPTGQQNQQMMECHQQQQMPPHNQNQPQTQQSSSTFRTPGTPGHYYGQSPAAATGGAPTPFQSPPPSHQMVGTPGAGGHHTPTGGHLTPVGTGGGPTPPYGSGGQVQPSGGHGTPLSTGDPANGGQIGGPASVHSQQQQQQVHTPQSYQQHQAVNEYYLQQQQQKMIAAQQQQMSQQMQGQGQRQASAQQQLAAQQQAASAQSSDNKAFPQLSDFADDALSDAVDLAVPGISSEGIEDFDLDSIEPMRCVDHGGVQHEHGGQNISQQGSHQQCLHHHSTGHNQQPRPLGMGMPHPQQQQQQQVAGAFFMGNQPHPQMMMGSQMVMGGQGRQQPPQFGQQGGQMHQQQRTQQQLGHAQKIIQIGQQQQFKQENHEQQCPVGSGTQINAEQRHTAEMMGMLPDRSPQLGDTPLSPSKLSETQEKNVSDAIASVMERVAKTGGGPNGGNASSTGTGRPTDNIHTDSGKNRGAGATTKRGSQGSISSTSGGMMVQSSQHNHSSSAGSLSQHSSISLSRTPTPQTPSSSGNGESRLMMGISSAPRTFSYPSGLLVNENGGASMQQHIFMRQSTTAVSSTTTALDYQPIHGQAVQQAQADSSTSASTTPTTASSQGGNGSGSSQFAQFNGHFHVPSGGATAGNPQHIPSSSTSPPSNERKTPLSAPVGKLNEPPQFDMGSQFMDTALALNIARERASSGGGAAPAKKQKNKRKGANEKDGQHEEGKKPLKKQKRANKTAMTGPLSGEKAIAAAESNSSTASAITNTTSTAMAILRGTNQISSLP